MQFEQIVDLNADDPDEPYDFQQMPFYGELLDILDARFNPNDLLGMAERTRRLWAHIRPCDAEMPDASDTDSTTDTPRRFITFDPRRMKTSIVIPLDAVSRVVGRVPLGQQANTVAIVDRQLDVVRPVFDDEQDEV
jgi:hypothetical protein